MSSDGPDNKTSPGDALHQAASDARADAHAVIKDAAQLARQAAALRADANRARADAQLSRPDALRTIPEAARLLHISERTLRRLLADPFLSARLVERTRKVGIYYKMLPLIPADLFADLSGLLPHG